MQPGLLRLSDRGGPRSAYTADRPSTSAAAGTDSEGAYRRVPRETGNTKRALGGVEAKHPDIHFVDRPTTLSKLAAGELKDAGSLYLLA